MLFVLYSHSPRRRRRLRSIPSPTLLSGIAAVATTLFYSNLHVSCQGMSLFLRTHMFARNYSRLTTSHPRISCQCRYYSWADGKKYHGKWKDNKRNGQGTCAYPNGNKYHGEWKDDKRHGQGTYTWANIGNKYTGGWKDDERHGKGKLIDVNGEKFTGEWVNDQMKDSNGKASKLRYNAV